MFYYEGTEPYIFLKTPKRLKVVIFHNLSDWLLVKIQQKHVRSRRQKRH